MSDIWEQKYCPKTLEDYVFQSQVAEEFFTGIVEKQSLPNILISGIQGTGKTTAAKMLINELGIERIDIKVINASSESGIDTVREDIQSFCETYPMGKLKVVLFEEADGLTNPAQKALRSLTDRFKDTVRFIFTCNYVHMVIEPLKSRCQHIHLDAFDEDALLGQAAFVLDQEGIEVNDIDLVYEHVRTYAPDLRKIINSIQQSSKTGTLKEVIQSEASAGIEEWQAAWSSNPTRSVLEPLTQFVDNRNFESFFNIMVDNVERLDEVDVDTAITTIADYYYRSYIVADHRLLLKACIIRIFNPDLAG